MQYVFRLSPHGRLFVAELRPLGSQPPRPRTLRHTMPANHTQEMLYV